MRLCSGEAGSRAGCGDPAKIKKGIAERFFRLAIPFYLYRASAAKCCLHRMSGSVRRREPRRLPLMLREEALHTGLGAFCREIRKFSEYW